MNSGETPEARALEIRTLTGESTSVTIAPNLPIGDLKAILKETFSPATKSPNFHLFFRGAKLSQESRVDSIPVHQGEFFVLVPFAKKPRPAQASQDPPAAPSSAAESAWCELKDELSNLHDIPSPDAVPNSSDQWEAFVEERSRKSSPPGKKRKADFESENKLVLEDILSSPLFDRGVRDRIRGVVEASSCLCDYEKGGCLLLEEFFRNSHGTEQCACPLWSKRVLKCFTFLNIFYGFLRWRGERMTQGCLEAALEKGSSFGLDEDVSILDVENLSVLCPKVVVILRQQKSPVSREGSAIIINYCSPEEDYHSGSIDKRHNTRKRVHISTIVNATGRRSSTFRTNLWKAVKYSLEKRQSETSTPKLSLQDLMTSISEGISLLEASKVKSGKSTSSASGCCEVDQLEPREMIEHLRNGLGIHGQIVHVEDIPAKLSVQAKFPDGLSEISIASLKRIGISSLYSHQAEAVHASLSGKNVVIATSTSSGKSLCYNIPVLESLSQNLLSCALYIFPTKALAQDQLRALLDMTEGMDIGLNISVYDGDTSQGHRSWIRDNARLLITNPDMLHVSILPYHKQFERLLSNLRFIIIDEAHTYKGAFGCHTAFVLRRLRRICYHAYGSDPSFIFSTATSANPRDHAMELANLRSLELIQKDGSPCGPKYFLLWNPPFQRSNGSKAKNKRERRSASEYSSTRRSSPILETSHLFAELVQHGLRCIAFCKTRKLTELVLCYTREILQETSPNLVDSICVYRGGYTPQDRRRIETDFFGGKLRGVAATNALELGIDVGHIDATLHLGFPGSVASLWQQAGRSGRRSRPSLSIYVAFEGPLDQYFMKFPHKLFQRSIEHCQVDSQNYKVLEQHVTCAALELPVCSHYDEMYFGSSLKNAIANLENKGYLCSDPLQISSTKLWSYIGPEERPSRAVSLRAIENDKYKVVDQSNSEVLEEIEESTAFFQVYEGAIYMNQGITYLVKVLNISERIALCEKTDVKYYTKTRDYTDIHVIAGDLAYPPVKLAQFENATTTARTSNCKVTTNWFGFYRIWRSNNRIFDSVELALPPYNFESQATWIRVPQSIKTALEVHELSFRAGLHSASHALVNVVPLYVMCNASDIGTECANPHETRAILERLLLYDKHPGGIGIVAQIQLLLNELLTAAMELVSTCGCLSNAGCPNCVQMLTCSEYNEVLDKKAAILILKGVIDAEKSYIKNTSQPSESSKN